MTVHTRAEYLDKLISGGMSPADAELLTDNWLQQQKSRAAPVVDTGDLFSQAGGSVDEVVGSETGGLIISSRQRALVEAGVKIQEEPPAGDEMAFMHSILCQVGLPRSKVKGYEFERLCGTAGVYIRAGKLWDGKSFVQQEIPYGPMPRLVLAYVNTEALRNRSPTVEVGNSASEMLRRLGKTPNGGKRSSYETFRLQTKALSACSMTIGISHGERAYTFNGQPIKEFQAWLANNEAQPTLWPGVITLSDEYFKTLSEHAVPLDFRALGALKGSALAMDIYAMLAERLHRISGRPVNLHWKSLRLQFGQEYTGVNGDKDFKRSFLEALKKVLEVYPTANVKPINGGLLLGSSPPPVPYKTLTPIG